MDVSKSENLTVLNQNNNVQEMLNNEIQNNEILSLSEDNTTLSASNTDNDGALGVSDSGTFANLRTKIINAIKILQSTVRVILLMQIIWVGYLILLLLNTM